MATVPPYSLTRVDFALDHIREQAEKRQFFNAIQACAELQSLLLRGLREVINGGPAEHQGDE